MKYQNTELKYCTTTVEFDYCEFDYCDKTINELEDLLLAIFPNVNIKNYFLKFLSASLNGT